MIIAPDGRMEFNRVNDCLVSEVPKLSDMETVVEFFDQSGMERHVVFSEGSKTAPYVVSEYSSSIIAYDRLLTEKEKDLITLTWTYNNYMRISRRRKKSFKKLIEAQSV